jgi:hypothetical protein
VYSGFIEITSLAETLKVTYLGVAARLKDKAILDISAKIFGYNLPALLDSSGKPQVGEPTYTLVNGDNPALHWRSGFLSTNC